MAIEGVVTEVADNLEEMAEATRRINSAGVGYFVGGLVVGLGLGFYWGWRYNKEAIRAEAFRQSNEEVEKIRELYQQKMVAATPKPPIDEVMEEAGYSDVAEVKEYVRPLRPPVPGIVEPTPGVAPPVVIYDGGKDKDRDWNFQEELKLRKEQDGDPYVIHQDEFMANSTDYEQVTYTYYVENDTLVDEDQTKVPLTVVGENNLKFGHGADDIDVVFVRNDELRIDIQVCRSPEGYEEDEIPPEGLDEPDESD